MNARSMGSRGDRPGRSFVVLLALALVVLAGAASVSAATSTVDCSVDPGALTSALAGAGDGDTLAVHGVCTGTFTIAHDLTLVGSSGATLDAQGAGTVVTVASGKTVTLANLTITGGSDPAAGGIRNAGTLTIVNSRVTGNSASVAQFSNGNGGIDNSGGNLTLVDSTVSGNTATASVPFAIATGGIFTSFGTLTLLRSTVSGNAASTPGAAFGGILSSGPGSVVTITNSTVSGNSGSADGGPSVYSSAVGGIFNAGGVLTITSSTLSGNTVSEPNGGSMPPVAGVANEYGGTVTVANSLVAAQSGGPNCDGFVVASDGGYNLDDGASCAFSAANHSLSGTNPLLDPSGLKDNGGPTQTIALTAASPAVNVIPSGVNGCGTTITVDQRGETRPQGSGCDIGSFELVVDTTPPVISVPAPVTVNATSPAGATVGYTVTATDPDDAVASLACVPPSGSTFPIGTTTVTCTAADSHGNSSHGSFTIKVKGAGDQLADLAAAVKGVGPGRSLADKVAVAQWFLAHGQPQLTCLTLTAFQLEVRAQSGKKIPAAQAAVLVADANRIKGVLGCTK